MTEPSTGIQLTDDGVAATESFVGIVIEGVVVALLVQPFFAR